jgi:hypothetical protein
MTPDELELRRREVAIRMLDVVGRATCEDAALICDVSKKTILAACKRLELIPSRRGKSYYFTKHSLNAWMGGE